MTPRELAERDARAAIRARWGATRGQHYEDFVVGHPLGAVLPQSAARYRRARVLEESGLEETATSAQETPLIYALGALMAAPGGAT